MAYMQGQTNVKDVLADFVTTVCFDETAVEKFENWTLLCPIVKQPGDPVSEEQEQYTVFSKQEAYNWILKKRRATIGSTFMPLNEWQYNEVFKVTQEYLDSFPDEIFIEEEIKLTKQELEKHNGIIKLPLERRITDVEDAEFYINEILNTNITPSEPIMFSYNNDYTTLGLLEFYIDIKNKQLCLLKDNFILNTNENFTLYIKYKTLPTFEIPILKTIYDVASIKVKIKDHKGAFYNNTELGLLNIMEFHPDVKNKKLILLKDTVDLGDDYEIVFLTSYQTYATNPISWYVEFTYPTHINSDNLNYNYFEWVFGNTLDWNSYQVQPNKGTKSPVFRCFWHTINKLKAQAADWLPIEYFISWDETAISFVMCEDPITDLNAVMHAFNYIGILENIENSDNDDILSNFGSCGSYDITVQVPGGIVNDMSLTRKRANITFVEKIYNSYFENSEERTLLKLNNVAYGNYTVGTDMVNDANLLTQQSIQYVIGDPTNPYANPAPVNSTFNGQPTSRYNILKKGTLADFILPINVKLVNPLNATATQITLAEECRVTVANGTPIIIPHYSAKIFIANPTITAINTATNLPETLSMGEAITLYADIVTIFNLGTVLNIPTNTLFVASNGKEYRTISIVQIFVDIIGFNINTLFTIQNDVRVYVPDDETYIREETILIGTTLRLADTYVETEYNSVEEYIVEFQYRDPYRGAMHYDFPSQWFDGVSRSKSFTDFTGSTPLLMPILEERMNPNSPFENEETINDKFIDSMRNKLSVRNRISYDTLNNSYHKNTMKTPKIITNIQTNESWIFEQTNVVAGVEKTIDSITNICMYPHQVYVGNFCYSKRTGQKAIINTRGLNSNFVLTNQNGVEIKIEFDADEVNTKEYKNLTISKDADGNMELFVDYNNLHEEKVYLRIFLEEPYYSVNGTRYGPVQLQCQAGCAQWFSPFLIVNNQLVINTASDAFGHLAFRGNQIYLKVPTTIQLAIAYQSFGADLFFEYSSGHTEAITTLNFSRLASTQTIPFNSSNVEEWVTAQRIPGNTEPQDAKPAVEAFMQKYNVEEKFQQIIQNLDTLINNSGTYIPFNPSDYQKAPIYLEIDLNNIHKTFIPKFISTSTITHNWV